MMKLFLFILSAFFFMVIALFSIQLLFILMKQFILKSIANISRDSREQLRPLLALVPGFLALRFINVLNSLKSPEYAMDFLQSYITERPGIPKDRREYLIRAAEQVVTSSLQVREALTTPQAHAFYVTPYTQFLTLLDEPPFSDYAEMSAGEAPSFTREGLTFLSAAIETCGKRPKERILIPVESLPITDIPPPTKFESQQINQLAKLRLEEILPPRIFRGEPSFS